MRSDWPPGASSTKTFGTLLPWWLKLAGKIDPSFPSSRAALNFPAEARKKARAPTRRGNRPPLGRFAKVVGTFDQPQRNS